MKKIIAVILFSMVISGCNTVNGIGKDVQKAGEGMSNAATKAAH